MKKNLLENEYVLRKNIYNGFIQLNIEMDKYPFEIYLNYNPHSCTEDTIAIDTAILSTIASLKSRPNINLKDRTEAYKELLLIMFRQRECSFENENENSKELLEIWNKILMYFKILDNSSPEENNRYTSVLEDLKDANKDVLDTNLKSIGEQLDLLIERYKSTERNKAIADTLTVYEENIPDMEKQKKASRKDEIALEELRLRRKKLTGDVDYLKDFYETKPLTKDSCETKGLDPIFEQRQKATCRVLASTSSNNKKSEATGWYIGNNLIVTNAHVILYKNEMSQLIKYDKILCNFDFLDKTSREAIIQTYDFANDIALLYLQDDEDLKDWKIPFAKNTDITMGQPVYTFGNTIGAGIVIQNGMIQLDSVSMIFFDENTNEFINVKDVIRTNIPIRDGNSGGPLFNDKGEAIGIMSCNLKDSNNNPCPELSVARKITCIQRLLK